MVEQRRLLKTRALIGRVCSGRAYKKTREDIPRMLTGTEPNSKLLLKSLRNRGKDESRVRIPRASNIRQQHQTGPMALVLRWTAKASGSMGQVLSEAELKTTGP